MTACIRCTNVESAGLCCSSHKAALCHACYRRTHFVEVCIDGCTDCAREGLTPRASAADHHARLAAGTEEG
jgi:hypothetical protein